MAKPTKSLELHYPMIEFLIKFVTRQRRIFSVACKVHINHVSITHFSLANITKTGFPSTNTKNARGKK